MYTLSRLDSGTKTTHGRFKGPVPDRTFDLNKNQDLLDCRTASPGQPFSAARDRLREFSPSLSPLQSDGRRGVTVLISVAELTRPDDRRVQYETTHQDADRSTLQQTSIESASVYFERLAIGLCK